MQKNALHRNVIVLGWVSFFNDFASAIITPLLPIYVVTILHNGSDKLGFIVALSTFISYFLRLLSGYISDRYGIVKPLVLGGYLLSAISKPLLAISASWQSVATLRALERLGKAIRSAPKDVLISSFSAKNHTGKAFGFQKMLDAAGEVSGALLVSIVLLWYGEGEPVVRGLFWFTLLPGLIAVVLVFFLVGDARQDPKNHAALVLAKQDRQLLPQLALYFLFTFFMVDEAYFILRSQEVGLGLALVPLLFICGRLVQLLSSYRIGIWFDRTNGHQLILVAYLAGIVSTSLFLLPQQIFTWLGFAGFGLYGVITLNSFRALIAGRAINKGAVYGVFYAGSALAAAGGVLLCGYLWEHLGSITALYISLSGMVITLILQWIYARRPVSSVE